MTRKTINTTNIYGNTVTVFDGDYVGRKIIKDGIYERLLIEFTNSLLSKINEPIVFDIGANIGNHSLAFSQKAKQVYGFEPVPDIFSVLTRNITQNNINNIKCFNIALSDTNEKDTIFLFDKNLGASSFDEHEKGLTPVEVSKRIGDEIVKEESIAKVDFLKIDTEGHEAFVILGLKETIKKFKPYVIIEWHDPLTIKRFKDARIFETLFDDYQVFVLGSNFDRQYWNNKAFAKTGRRLTRLLLRKKSRLYTFEPDQSYKNILLVPPGSEQNL